MIGVMEFDGQSAYQCLEKFLHHNLELAAIGKLLSSSSSSPHRSHTIVTPDCLDCQPTENNQSMMFPYLLHPQK
jgi:hypothetical protein